VAPRRLIVDFDDESALRVQSLVQAIAYRTNAENCPEYYIESRSVKQRLLHAVQQNVQKQSAPTQTSSFMRLAVQVQELALNP